MAAYINNASGIMTSYNGNISEDNATLMFGADATTHAYTTPFWFQLCKVFLGLFGMLGNSTVIYIYVRKKDLRASECFIISIALIDFCFSFISMVLWIFELFGLHARIVNSTLFTVVAFYSLYLIFWMSFNRYIAVIKPIEYMSMFTSVRVALIIISGFFFGCFYGVITLWFYITANETIQKSLDAFYFTSKAFFILVDIVFMCLVYTNVTYSQAKKKKGTATAVVAGAKASAAAAVPATTSHKYCKQNQPMNKTTFRRYSREINNEACPGNDHIAATNHDDQREQMFQPILESLPPSTDESAHRTSNKHKYTVVRSNPGRNNETEDTTARTSCVVELNCSNSSILQAVTNSDVALQGDNQPKVIEAVVEFNDEEIDREDRNVESQIYLHCKNGSVAKDSSSAATPTPQRQIKLKECRYQQSFNEGRSKNGDGNNRWFALKSKRESSRFSKQLSVETAYSMASVLGSPLRTGSSTPALSSTSQRKRDMRQRRVTVTLFFVSAVFMLVTLPFTIVELIQYLPPIFNYQRIAVPRNVLLVTYLFYCINFVINPLVYLFGNSFYKTELTLLVKKIVCCGSS